MLAINQMSATEIITRLLNAQISMQGWQFYLSDEDGADRPVNAEEVASDVVFLPAILWQAEKFHKMAHGRGLDVKFESDPDAFLGVRGEVVRSEMMPRAPLPLFCVEVLAKAMEDHPVLNGGSLNHLVNTFLADVERGLVPGVPQGAPQRSWLRESVQA